MRISWGRILKIGNVIFQNNSFSICHQFFDIGNFKRFFCFDVYRFGVATNYRNPDSCRCNLNAVVIQDLTGFMNEFHFLFGVVIFEENITVRNAVQVNIG